MLEAARPSRTDCAGSLHACLHVSMKISAPTSCHLLQFFGRVVHWASVCAL